ncbi:MAG: nitrite/sulfite reductase [Sulfurovum sp.]|nr:nitrite/sulfite reductase [Sulfurovum sp.]
MIVEIKENTDKLNWRERLKVERKPHDFLENIEKIHFSMIGDNDRAYLQDAGIYNHEAEEDMFALRLRFNAGRISPTQMLTIAKIVNAHDLDIILTARAQMQLHGLDYDNILEVWKEINDSGMSTWQTFGDNVRNIVTDVYDGRGTYSEIEVYPYIEQMQEYILNKPKFIGLLPRRVSVGISGNRANLNSFFANDLFFALAEKDNIKGFNVFLGGKNSELAQDADVFLKPSQVVDYFIAVIESFHLHGFRGTRGKTRLFHWLEKEGMEGIKKKIDKEHTLIYEERGTLLLEKYDRSTSKRLKDNTFVYAYHTDFARVSAETFITLAKFATEHKAEVRLGVNQHMYFLGLESDVTPFENTNTVSTISACAGSEHCNFSFWHVKDDTAYLPLELIEKHNIMVGFSSCDKGCGKHQHCDIGLIGMKTSAYGRPAHAARVYLGGEHTFGLNVARYLNISVPKAALNSFLEVIIKEFEHSKYAEFEAFSKEVLNTYSADFLCLWFLAKLSTKTEVFLQKNDAPLEQACTQGERNRLNETFSSLMPSSDFKASSEISRLSKSLWKVEAKVTA